MTVRALCIGTVLGCCQIPAGPAIAQLPQPPAPQPSFDCAKAADRIGQIICSDAELARWDARMGQAYRQRFTALGASERGALLEDQRRWLASRGAQCNQAEIAAAKPCILQITKARLATLEQKDGPPRQSVPLTAADKQNADPSAEQRRENKFNPGDPYLSSTAEDADAALNRGDYVTALRLLRSFAEKGNALAQFNLGLMHRNGRGVPKNDAEAARWFRLAANQGVADAQWNLGRMYLYGYGVPQNNAEAMRWYGLAAAQGNDHAQFMLGFAHAGGVGVPQNYAESARWFRLAADQGNVNAQFLLGAAYARGLGIAQDDIRAHMWLNMAAAGGNQEAAEYRDNIARRMIPAQIAEAQKLAAEWRPNTSNSAPGTGPALVRRPNSQVYDATICAGEVFTSLGWRAEIDSMPACNFDVRTPAGKKILQACGIDNFELGIPGQIWDCSVSANVSVRIVENGPLKGRWIDQLFSVARWRAAEWRPKVANAAPRDAGAAIPPAQKSNPERFFGTAFFVSTDGKALTNAHVVNQCTQVRVAARGQESAARVMARDEKNDLALLATGINPPQPASWRLSLRQGEDIVVYGFPLAGVPAAGGNVATGNVTALAGLGNDSRFLQISAPVQQGNSGGPLLDRNGNVVGVVVSKLNALNVASVTGDIPQNVNFAIKASVAAAFLDAQHVAHTEAAGAAALSTPDIAERANALTAQVTCIR